MPIHRHTTRSAPIGWRELAASIRFRRGVLHFADGDHETMCPGAGVTGPASGCAAYRRPTASSTKGSGAPVSRRRPATATDNNAANLAEPRQRCHILHHKPERLRRERHSAQRAIVDLFTGPHR